MVNLSHYGKVITAGIALYAGSMLCAADISFLPYGDSKTFGQGDDTEKSPKGKNGYPPILAELSGFIELPRIARPGWTVKMMNKKIKDDLKKYVGDSPTFILINLGANDLQPNKKSKWYVPLVKIDWESELGNICDEMHKKWPNAQIGIMRVWRRYASKEALILNDEWIANVAKSRNWVFVGPDERLFLLSKDNGKGMSVDGIHPNHAGYSKTAEAWREWIEKRLKIKKNK